MPKASDLATQLINMVVETVEDIHPDPVPVGVLYSYLMSVGITFQDFQSIIILALASGRIRKGSMPHTLVVATPDT